jgi:CBS domain-containing membrane protein
MAVLGREHGIASDFSFMLAPVGLNALLMLVMALAINNLMGRHYPARAYPTRDKKHQHDDPKPLDRLGIDKNDLHQALRDMDVYLDVSEADLKQIFNRAGMHAYQRKMGEITCGDIMSRDVTSVEFGTELEEAWAQLRFHKIAAIPVVDSARRVIGIISLVDFLKRANLKTYETFEDRLIKFIRRTPGLRRRARWISPSRRRRTCISWNWCPCSPTTACTISPSSTPSGGWWGWSPSPI